MGTKTPTNRIPGIDAGSATFSQGIDVDRPHTLLTAGETKGAGQAEYRYDDDMNLKIRIREGHGELGSALSINNLSESAIAVLYNNLADGGQPSWGQDVRKWYLTQVSEIFCSGVPINSGDVLALLKGDEVLLNTTVGNPDGVRVTAKFLNEQREVLRVPHIWYTRPYQSTVGGIRYDAQRLETQAEILEKEKRPGAHTSRIVEEIGRKRALAKWMRENADRLEAIGLADPGHPVRASHTQFNYAEPDGTVATAQLIADLGGPKPRFDVLLRDNKGTTIWSMQTDSEAQAMATYAMFGVETLRQLGTGGHVALVDAGLIFDAATVYEGRGSWNFRFSKDHGSLLNEQVKPLVKAAKEWEQVAINALYSEMDIRKFFKCCTALDLEAVSGVLRTMLPVSQAKDNASSFWFRHDLPVDPAAFSRKVGACLELADDERERDPEFDPWAAQQKSAQTQCFEFLVDKVGLSAPEHGGQQWEFCVQLRAWADTRREVGLPVAPRIQAACSMLPVAIGLPDVVLDLAKEHQPLPTEILAQNSQIEALNGITQHLRTNCGISISESQPLQTPEYIDRRLYFGLNFVAQSFELEAAKGVHTSEKFKAMRAEVKRLMDAAPWELVPGDGAQRKALARTVLIDGRTKIPVMFVSVWDEGEVETRATLDLRTGHVTDIATSEDEETVNYQHLQFQEIRDCHGATAKVTCNHDNEYVLENPATISRFDRVASDNASAKQSYIELEMLMRSKTTHGTDTEKIRVWAGQSADTSPSPGG